MKFECIHVFAGITLAEYETMYFDEGFNVALCAATKLSRTGLKDEHVAGHRERVVRVAPEGQLPKPMAKALGADTLAYDEYVSYDDGTYQGKWHTTPLLSIAKKVKSEGGFQFREAKNGVERRVFGTIELAIPIVGGAIERFIVGETEKRYDDAARFTQGWINAGKHRIG